MSEEILLKLDDAIIAEREEEGKRRGSHLAMSQIGKLDERQTWLNWRFSLPNDRKARTYRIFSLGDAVEDEIAKLLKKIPGMTVYTEDENGEQFGFKELNGHLTGRMDGCVNGVPGHGGDWMVLESKSANENNFRELIRKSIQQWSDEYYGQSQMYMHFSGMKKTLFVVYNKNNSEVYFEVIEYNKTEAVALVEKAKRLMTMLTFPASIFQESDYRLKKFKSEEWQAVYWNLVTPEKPNCRNCIFGEPLLNTGDCTWVCKRKNNVSLTLETQKEGCGDHLWVPCFMPKDVTVIEWSAEKDAIEYRCDDGTFFYNTGDQYHGNAGKHGYFTSKEIAVLSRQDCGLCKQTVGDKNLNDMKEHFNARVIDQ